MNISFYTVESNLKTNNGYGYAGYHVRNSLENLGHTVNFHDKHADVNINFCQADLYKNFKGQYSIGYTPWESSQIPFAWYRGFAEVDEIWTTSQMCKDWYRSLGIKKPIFVYEHGIEPVWSPKKRRADNKLKFLHIGEPAPRKGGQMALEAFRVAFGAREDVHLTIKAHGHSTVRAYESHINRGGARSILGPVADVYKNVTLLSDNLSLEELVRLYHDHDVLVYPSWGEGFGLIPLQALATGMPTICTSSWAPYARHLGELSLDSKRVQSPWPDMHPGDMFKPDIEHLISLYRYTHQKFDKLSESFYDSANDIHREYDWDILTENAFKHLGELNK